VVLDVTPLGGRALTTVLPPVRALLVAPARELVKFYGTPPTIHKIVPDSVSASRYVIELLPGDVSVTGGTAKVEDVQPRSIVVSLDDVARKTVPVVPKVTIHPDSGFDVVGGIGVAPGSVTISGPVALVAAVNDVSTLPLDITGASGPITQVVAIDTSALGVLHVVPRAVEVAADVAPISERVLMGVPVSFSGDHTGWESDPLAVIVTVRGPAGRLHRLTRDSVIVIAVPLGRGGSETVHLDVVAPAGINATATPEEALVQRRARG
ncbi:MAG TPA: CdaR family protein, partial [Gemmatimonadales bacterium]